MGKEIGQGTIHRFPSHHATPVKTEELAGEEEVMVPWGKVTAFMDI